MQIKDIYWLEIIKINELWCFSAVLCLLIVLYKAIQIRTQSLTEMCTNYGQNLNFDHSEHEGEIAE